MAGLASLLGVLLFATRVAVVASASSADGQPPLRYADRDADRVVAVLRDLGGFDHIEQLRDPTPGALRAALARVEALAAGDPSLEMVFYYSGHADAHGLLLGTDRFAFAELRTHLERSRAAVRVAFLDACYAGAMVRAKGGAPAPGYTLDVVEPPHVRGAAILAAGTAAELAQESGDIEGSYFTYHMLAGLRGAGDRDGNGLVTLAEAYQYAYSHTLAATLPSLFGPQHPSYEYLLSGTGDLVVTRVGRDRQALSFPSAHARTYVVATAAGEVMAEVAARPDGRVRLVLPRGRYRVTARDEQSASVGDIALGVGAGAAQTGDVAVESATFRPLAPELAFAKGARLGARHELAVEVALAGLGPGAINATPELGIGYAFRGARYSVGPQLTYGSAGGTLAGVSFALQRWTVNALALRRIALGFSEVQVGGAAGVAAIRERLSADPARFGWAPQAAAVLAIDVPLARWLALRLSWSGGGQILRVDEKIQVRPELRSSLALVFRR